MGLDVLPKKPVRNYVNLHFVTVTLTRLVYSQAKGRLTQDQKEYKMISIYVKVLSGDVVEVLLNEETTYHGLYQEVYDTLPEGVYPDAIWQMTLTRPTQDGEYEEVPDTEEKANPQEGEMFCAYMETRWIEIEEGLRWRGYDAYLDDPTAVSERDWLYTRAELCFLINGGEKVVRDYFLQHCETGRYYLSHGVEELEWFGRFKEEFLFRFTERTEGFATREEMMDAWLSQWEGYSNRTKAHVKREWMKMYVEEQEEQEEQEEEQVAHYNP